MSTPKEIFLELIRPDGQPERQLRQYEALHMCLTDPCNTYLRGNRKRGSVSKDRWGTTISFPEDAPGPIPVHTPELSVCTDVTRWKETIHVPDLSVCSEGWEECRTRSRAAADAEGKLLAGFMGTGIFEQCHFLMGFEDTLTALYEHPDEMHELIETITQYRLDYVRRLIDGLQPDVIFSHDDWGTKNALFMKPDMWREFFKEPYRRFYGYIRSRGVIAIHHADSYLVPIVDDMAEIGIQVWQGVLPENDIPALQAHLNGRLTLMGGFGAAIDRKDATPEDILTYARDVLKRNCPGGHYIPSITYGLAGTVYPHVDKYLNQAVDAYNAALHVPVTHLPPVPRRSVHTAAAPAQSAPEAEQPQGDVLSRIASALVRGQQKRVLQLCSEALESGHGAQEILTDGLVRGMTILGEDFSANRAFVPEMLIAARCMAAMVCCVLNAQSATRSAGETVQALRKPWIMMLSPFQMAKPGAQSAPGFADAISYHGCRGKNKWRYAENVCREAQNHGFCAQSASSAAYSASVTGSHHSLLQSSPGTSTAMWLNQLSALAPCQCLTLAGIMMTLPSCRLTAGLPSS